MKKALKKHVVFILCVLIAATTVVSICAATIINSNGYVLLVEDDDSTALNGWNSEGKLTVPNSVDSYYISSIADYAFMDNKSITGVDFSKAYTLREIGYMSFSGCSELSDNITIPSRVNKLGMGAFQNCSSISTVDLYSGSRSVPVQMFYNCDSLEKVVINYGFTSIGKLAFANCEALNEVTISWTVSEIHSTAFYNCPNLVIRCFTGSYAQTYAEEKGINYVLIDAPAPTEPPTEAPTTAPTEEPTTASTEAPTLEPTEAPTESSEYILGDADGNGVIEVDDATFIQRVIAELPVPYPMETLMQGDVDGDGELTVADATLIQRFIAEMATYYPIGQPIE